MAGRGGDKADEKGISRGAKLKEVQRGTQDELEILVMILKDHPHLLQSVYERVRAAKAYIRDPSRSGLRPEKAAAKVKT